jgi:hypothetical protein
LSVHVRAGSTPGASTIFLSFTLYSISSWLQRYPWWGLQAENLADAIRAPGSKRLTIWLVPRRWQLPARLKVMAEALAAREKTRSSR